MKRGLKANVHANSREGRRYLPIPSSDDEACDLVLIDLPYADDAIVQTARQNARKTVGLDFVGQIAPDLMISIFKRESPYPECKHLVGLDYAIIREDVRGLAPAPKGSGVIVMIGGGDQQGIGEAAATTLCKAGCDVTLVEGPLAQSSSPLDSRIVRLSQPTDIAERMAHAAWGVTGAGGAMMEMMCLGKPVYVVPRNKLESALASIVCNKGLILGMGLESLKPPSPEQGRMISDRAMRAVDGRGVDRISDEIQALL